MDPYWTAEISEVINDIKYDLAKSGIQVTIEIIDGSDGEEQEPAPGQEKELAQERDEGGREIDPSTSPD